VLIGYENTGDIFDYFLECKLQQSDRRSADWKLFGITSNVHERNCFKIGGILRTCWL